MAEPGDVPAMVTTAEGPHGGAGPLQGLKSPQHSTATGAWQTSFMREGHFSFLFHKKMGFFTVNYTQTIMLLTALPER